MNYFNMISLVKVFSILCLMDSQVGAFVPHPAMEVGDGWALMSALQNWQVSEIVVVSNMSLGGLFWPQAGAQIRRSLTIRGETHACGGAQCWLDAGGSSGNMVRHLRVTKGGQLIVHNILFTGGFLNDPGTDMAEPQGGAVFITEGGYGHFENCTFRGNAAIWGGAVAVFQYAAFQCTQCIFMDNTARQEGGAVRVRGSQVVGTEAVPRPALASFHNSAFHSNTARYGGALYVFYEGNLTLQDSAFERNHARIGGAVYLAYGSAVVVGGMSGQNNACSFTNISCGDLMFTDYFAPSFFHPWPPAESLVGVDVGLRGVEAMEYTGELPLSALLPLPILPDPSPPALPPPLASPPSSNTTKELETATADESSQETSAPSTSWIHTDLLGTGFDILVLFSIALLVLGGCGALLIVKLDPLRKASADETETQEECDEESTIDVTVASGEDKDSMEDQTTTLVQAISLKHLNPTEEERISGPRRKVLKVQTASQRSRVPLATMKVARRESVESQVSVASSVKVNSRTVTTLPNERYVDPRFQHQQASGTPPLHSPNHVQDSANYDLQVDQALHSPTQGRFQGHYNHADLVNSPDKVYKKGPRQLFEVDNSVSVSHVGPVPHSERIRPTGSRTEIRPSIPRAEREKMQQQPPSNHIGHNPDNR